MLRAALGLPTLYPEDAVPKPTPLFIGEDLVAVHLFKGCEPADRRATSLCPVNVDGVDMLARLAGLPSGAGHGEVRAVTGL